MPAKSKIDLRDVHPHLRVLRAHAGRAARKAAAAGLIRFRLNGRDNEGDEWRVAGGLVRLNELTPDIAALFRPAKRYRRRLKAMKVLRKRHAARVRGARGEMARI